MGTVVVTNAVWSESGINKFMQRVFDADSSAVMAIDDRTYGNFKATLPVSDFASVTLEDGVIGVAEGLSVYAPVDGVVSGVYRAEDGRYRVEISHNGNFSTVIDGLKYVYASAGDKAFSNVPIGYSAENTSVCFNDGNGVKITGYSVAESGIVWSV